jgi:hypothetical protein
MVCGLIIMILEKQRAPASLVFDLGIDPSTRSKIAY